jgi:hypothetical protein
LDKRFTTVQHGYTGLPDGGLRPPPGGLPYGVEPCGEIRGIREIRGHDQPVGGSPGVICRAFREEIFCRASSGRSSPSTFGVNTI